MSGGAVAIFSVTDLTCQAGSFTTNAKRDIAPEGSWNIWTKMYIGDTDPHDPLLSPLMSDLSGLCPIYLCVGSNEIHLDDTINFGNKALNAGVQVELKVWPKMVHAFPILSPLFPEAKKALRDICRFIKKSV